MKFAWNDFENTIFNIKVLNTFVHKKYVFLVPIKLNLLPKNVHFIPFFQFQIELFLTFELLLKNKISVYQVILTMQNRFMYFT